jgi:TPR repeat protein
MFVDFYAAENQHQNISLVSGVMDYYERGIACSRSSECMDLVEAHKWFNLAAARGDDRGTAARMHLAMEMTAREIAEAQRRARSFKH